MSAGGSSRAARVVGSALVLAAALAFGYRAGQGSTPAKRPPDATIAVTDTSTVVAAIRRLSRLESVAYHMERIIDLKQRKEHLFGLLESDDQILLVAVGEVIAGVDLAKLEPGAVSIDAQRKRLRIRLPAPEILSVRLDNDHTYVHSRKHDLLAEPDQDIETKARQQAEQSIREAALAASILPRARQSAEQTIISLAHAFGHGDVEIIWPEPLLQLR